MKKIIDLLIRRHTITLYTETGQKITTLRYTRREFQMIETTAAAAGLKVDQFLINAITSFAEENIS
jgi:uncharacterized protein (DUF1778 family)